MGQALGTNSPIHGRVFDGVRSTRRWELIHFHRIVFLISIFMGEHVVNSCYQIDNDNQLKHA